MMEWHQIQFMEIIPAIDLLDGQ
jgi:hypothetical protein